MNETQQEHGHGCQPSWLSTESYGLIVLVLSAVLFSVMGTFLKLATDTGLPSTQMVFFRAFFQGSVVVICACFCRTAQGNLVITRPLGDTREISKIVILRGAIGGMGFCLYFFTLSALPLGDAIATLSLYPIATIFFGRFFLGEPIKFLHVIAAIASVVGTILIASPSFMFGPQEQQNNSDVNPIGYVTGVLGSCFASGVVTLIRKAGMVGAHTLQLLLSWASFGLLFSLFFGLIPSVVLNSNDDASWQWPNNCWLYIFAACTIGSAAHFMLNYAGRLTPASLAAIARSTDILWAYLSQVWVFDEIPTSRTCVGVLLICAALVVVICVQRRGVQEESSGNVPVGAEKIPTHDFIEENCQVETGIELDSAKGKLMNGSAQN